MNRRDVNGTLAGALAALVSAKSGALLRAEEPPARENFQDQTQSKSSAAVQTLMQEPLAEVPNAEVR